MNASAPTAGPQTLRSHQRELRGVIEKAIELSFPLYTYKELKRLLRCEYHGFVSDLREDRTWDEITSVTGMSRAGLNKLGDEVPPTPHHNALRVLALTLQKAGDDGMRIGNLAAAYYEQDPECSGPGLKECLHSLMRAGMVERKDDRYMLTNARTGYHETFPDAIARTVREVAIRASKDGEDRAHRATFSVPNDPDAIRQIHKSLIEAVVGIIEKAEAQAAESDSTRTMTVVLAGSPNVY
ncbi:MAG: hypothetical protein ACI9MC_001315 [Kiritimatiellia bacterium]|jgi:hypothetical protein